MNLAKVAREKIQGAWGCGEVEARGRTWIRLRNTLEPQKRAAVFHMGAIHISETDVEIDTEWRPNDNPNYAQYQLKMELADYHAYAGQDANINFDAANIIKYVHPESGEELDIFPYPDLVYTNDLDQIQVIGSVQQVGGTVDDDTITWAGGYGAGFDFTWQTQTERLFKVLTVNERSSFPAPEQYIIDGGNPVLKLELQFQKSSNVEIWINGQKWDEKSNNPQETTADVEFRLGTGEVLWRFRYPLAWSEGDSIQPIMRLLKRANNLFVQILTPWGWLDNADYPVRIDASTNPQVGASSDDAEQRASDGFMNLTRDPHYHCYFGVGKDYGYRFSSVTITNGVTIDTAYLQFYSAGVNSDTDFYTDFYGEDNSNPGTFTTTTSDIDNRTKTTASVAWDTPESWSNNTWYNSPELKTILQELEDSYDYSGGAPIVIMNFFDSGTDTRKADSYDGSTTTCAKLYVEWTEGAPEIESQRTLIGVGV